jgi:uncharacterized protein (UPF0261 family)
MHDLVIDVDGFVWADVDQLVDDINGHVHAGAKAAGICKDELHGTQKCSHNRRLSEVDFHVRMHAFG